MTPATTPKRSKKLHRRFSSASSGGVLGSLPTPISRGRQKQRSHSPLDKAVDQQFPFLRPTLTDASDVEDESDFPPSVASDPHIFRTPPPRPRIYTSLPPTPISRSPTARPESPETPVSPIGQSPEPPEIPQAQLGGSATAQVTEAPFSLWDYLREELLATDFDSHQEMKWERVSNFLYIPIAMEKIIGFGFILCLDSFLYTFTILPIRFFLAVLRLLGNIVRISSPPLPPSQKADILRALLLMVSVAIMSPLTDASKIYHTIRGQDTIKLYVIFNSLEIADRLCASIGQDILDCLFSRSTLEPLSHRAPITLNIFKPLLFFVLALVYNIAHAMVMVYQLISLNVAVNSYDHALLTLLMSNQFVEIKGSVFKKFEKDTLFQITCADIVERFTLTLMLWVVAFRNLIELSGSEFDFSSGFVLPKSFGWFRGNNVLWTISYPVMTVLGSEMLVDWLKHAFITKFNHIRPSVYERYTDVLCRDLASGSAVGRRGARKHSYVDQSPLVARRLGFASMPLAVVAIIIGAQSINLLLSLQFESEMETPMRIFSFFPSTSLLSLSIADIHAQLDVHSVKWIVMCIAFWLCSVVVKIIMGVNLVSYATQRRAGMEARAAADVVNDFGRDPIGESKEEKKYNRELKTLLDNKLDDAPRVPEMGEKGSGGGGGGNGKGGRIQLEDLTRYTMLKRIW